MKTICLSILLVLLIGCKEETEEALQKQPVAEEVSYLALGDSYTIGESVEQGLRWPVQLADSLRKRGIPVANPEIIAQTGWTTQDLLNAMDEKLASEKFDLVSLLIGVNNQYQGKSIAEYEEDLRVLFTRAIDYSKTGKDAVFAVSIPDYGATPFGASREEEIGKEIDEFNAVFKRVASEFGVEFYNITPISRQAKEDPTLVASDGLHPSGKMYSQWVEEFVDEVEEKVVVKN